MEKSRIKSLHYGMDNEGNDKPIHDEHGRFAHGNQAHTMRENVGRPKKLPRFLEVFKCVMEEPHPVGRSIVCTDEDLLALVNERLDACDRVSPPTLTRWKKQDWDSPEDRAMGEDFRRLYRRSLIEQKLGLFDKMSRPSESRCWGRWAWIIERKFDEWNLRTKSVDETPDRKQLVFRVAPEGEDGDGDGSGDGSGE